MWGYHDGSWDAGDWFVMSAMMLLFWTLVIGAVLVSGRSFGGRRGETDEAELRRRRESSAATSARPRNRPRIEI